MDLNQIDLSTAMNALNLSAEARLDLDKHIERTHEEIVNRVADILGEAMAITKMIRDTDAYRTGFILPEDIRILVDTKAIVKADNTIFRTEARLQDPDGSVAVLTSKDLTVFWNHIPHGANRFNHSG